jgi:uroporphyrinogen-III synthase
VSRPLLILRPEPGASATAAKAVAMGMATIVRPLFETHAIEWTAPAPAMFDCVLLTSANAALHAGPELANYLHLPVYAVGESTARAAMASGFEKVIAGNRDAAGIVQTMINDGRQSVLHLAGRDRTAIDGSLPRITVLPVYASEILPPPIIPNGTVTLLHSVRAASCLAALSADKRSTALVTISRAVADAAGPGWQSVVVAEQPQDAAMLALAARLCETREE